MRLRKEISDDIEIREPRNSDINELAGLVRQEAECAMQQAKFYQLTPEFDWSYYVQEKLRVGNLRILVAAEQNRVIGYVEFRIQRINQKPPSRIRRFVSRLINRRRDPRLPLVALTRAMIEGCFISARYRRRGIGGSLITAALVRCAEVGVDRIELGVLADNVNAIHFWESMGFKSYRIALYRSVPRT